MNNFQLTAELPVGCYMKKSICIIILLSFLACKKSEVPVIYYTDNNVVAHRGAWADYHLPQNSIASLRKAIEMNCAGSEFDVWLTQDDSLVVTHDPNYGGHKVERSTYAELAKTRLSNGEILPTLRQYLAAGAGQNQTILFLEIKSMTYKDEVMNHITDKVTNLVNDMQMQVHIIYTSFHFSALQRVHQNIPNAKTFFLGGGYAPDYIRSSGISGLAYDIDTFYKHSNWPQIAKNDNLSLCAWIVNDNDQFQWLYNNKFDYIITDEPNNLFRWIDKMH
ncbi:MAG: glycerophosphodiester phosphodiesterase [Bacteroidetes bacterium]|nr:glycerophosphodiester phosphodiesterase [Bacteroidota bacterium]